MCPKHWIIQTREGSPIHIPLAKSARGRMKSTEDNYTGVYGYDVSMGTYIARLVTSEGGRALADT